MAKVKSKAKKTKSVAKKAAKPAKKAKPAAKKAAKSAKPAKKTVPKAKKSAAKATAPKKSALKTKKTVLKTAAATAAKNGTKASSKNLSNIVSPLDDRVLIRLTSEERTTASGLIIIPETAAVSGNLKGEVVAVGRGHVDKKGRLRPVDLKLGDQVLFAQYSGAKVTLMQEELVILRESEILGVLET